MARDRQTQIDNVEETTELWTVTPKQFRQLVMMRVTAGVPKQPNIQAEILRREVARRQEARGRG